MPSIGGAENGAYSSYTLPAASGDGFEDLVIAGRYIDRYEKRSGEWKIAYRSERNDWSRTSATNDPYFDATPNGLRGGREDDAVYDKTNRRKRA